MKLIELQELNEAAGDANVFLRFYSAWNEGGPAHGHRLPDVVTVDKALSILEHYYNIDWYDKRPRKAIKEIEVYKAFVRQLQQIRRAMRSKDERFKVQAVDDGINQWHIDYPIVAHLGMENEDEEMEWEEVLNVLEKLGRQAKESPYAGT